MDVLVTSSRLPFALEAIRKLGRSGHRVYAADTFRSAPGSHSRHVTEAFVVASPRYDTRRFVEDVEEIVRDHHVDLLLPAFEEVFYLAKHGSRLARHTHVFAPSFETLHRLHDKLRFLELAREVGLRVPRTLIAEDRTELARACRDVGRFFARPAYTRGGVLLYTNCGPLAGLVSLAECHPSPENPFLVQPFVEGFDLCTYSIVHDGRVAAHSSYVHPLTLEHAGGIVFESVEVKESLDAVRAIAEATGYDGQISLDLMQTRRGIEVIECNPRASAGLIVMPDSMFDDGLRDRRPNETLVAPAGMRRKLSLALIRNMVVRRRQASASLDALMSKGSDVYADPHDLAPLVFQLFAYARVIGYRMRQRRIHRTDLMQGYFYDLVWNGEEMAA